MTAGVPGKRPGEYIVNGNVVRSARRLREYLSGRAANREREGMPPKDVFHVIRPKYCEMLGIDPEEMIAISLTEVWRTKFEADIDENFRRLEAMSSLPQRILEAHRAAYLGGMEKSLAFIEEKFFRER